MNSEPTSNHTIRCVLFDLGGTLIYFDGDWKAVEVEASRELTAALLASGVDLDAGAFMAEFNARMGAYYDERDSEFIEHTTRYVLETLLAELGLRDVPEAALQQALAAMYAVSQAHWRPEADAVPTLEALRGAGYRLGLVSNASDDADVQWLVDSAGLREYFATILVSAAVGIRKPHPHILELALEALDARPEESVMVGDTLGADILGAHNAGIASVWITRRADTPDNRAHAETIRPDATIAALSELPALLRDWRPRE